MMQRFGRISAGAVLLASLFTHDANAQPLIGITAVDTSEPLRMFVHDEQVWGEIAPDIFAPADRPAYSVDEEPATAFPHQAALRKAVRDADVAEPPALWCVSYVNRYMHTRMVCQAATD